VQSNKSCPTCTANRIYRSGPKCPLSHNFDTIKSYTENICDEISCRLLSLLATEKWSKIARLLSIYVTEVTASHPSANTEHEAEDHPANICCCCRGPEFPPMKALPNTPAYKSPTITASNNNQGQPYQLTIQLCILQRVFLPALVHLLPERKGLIGLIKFWSGTYQTPMKCPENWSDIFARASQSERGMRHLSYQMKPKLNMCDCVLNAQNNQGGWKRV